MAVRARIADHVARGFIAASQRVRSLIGPLAEQALRLGVNIVFDFGANTVAHRAWSVRIFETAARDHVLHVLDVPIDECRRRVHARNATKPEGLSRLANDADHRCHQRIRRAAGAGLTSIEMAGATIQRAGAQMADILENLLEVTSLEAAQPSLTTTEVDLVPLTRDVVPSTGKLRRCTASRSRCIRRSIR